MFPEELYKQIEAATRNRQWATANRRNRDRLRLRANCIVRSISGNGVHVCSKEGRTRDVSRGGVGLLMPLAYATDTEIHVAIQLDDGKRVDMTGIVTYAKLVRHGWYLIGVKFGKVSDKRLCGQTNQSDQKMSPSSHSAETRQTSRS